MEAKSYLEKSSRNAALFSLVGILLVAGGLIVSFYYLNVQYEKLQRVNKEIDEKQAQITEAEHDLDEKQRKLNETKKVCADYQVAVESAAPEIDKVAVTETIKENPQATQILQAIRPPDKPITKVPSDRLKVAKAKEREGFEALLKDDYDRAIAAFQESENTYNSYHQVYELARFLKKNKAGASDPEQRRKNLETIAEKYSYGAPPDLLAQIVAESQRPKK